MAAYNTNTLASLYRKARGIGENALSMLTSGFAEPAAGYAATAAAATGYDAEGARDAIRERMTYAPKTAEGVRYMSELARVMSAVNNSAPVTTWKKGVDIAGRYSPTAGAVLASVPTAIGVATGAKPALQQGRSISMLAQRMQDGMVNNAMVPRKLHPQAGVINIDEDSMNLFHGTSGFHTKLSDKYAGSVSSGDGRGFWFSKSPSYAWEYAENAAGKRGGLPRVAKANVNPGKSMIVEFNENGNPVVNGIVYKDIKTNSEIIDKAMSEGYDSIDWVHGSFTDEPSLTIFDPKRAAMPLDKDDMSDLADFIKTNLKVPDEYDGGLFDLSNIKKTKDGYLYGGYIYEDFADAVDDYVDEQLSHTKAP